MQDKTGREKLRKLDAQIDRLGRQRLLTEFASLSWAALCIAALYLIGPIALVILFLGAGVRFWSDRRFQRKMSALTVEAQGLADKLDHVERSQRLLVRRLDDEIGCLWRRRSGWQWFFATLLIFFFSGFGVIAIAFGTKVLAIVAMIVCLIAAMRLAVISRRLRKAERELKSLGARSRYRFRYPL